MKNPICRLFLLFFLLPLISLGQVKDQSRTTKPKKTIKNSTVKKNTPLRTTVASYAYLIISTDLDVKVTVNYSHTKNILASQGGAKMPLDKGKNIVNISPMDGGSDGYIKTINVYSGDKGENLTHNIKLRENRKEEQARKSRLAAAKLKKDNCRICKGTGELSCTKCSGDGRIKCSTCGACSNCGGSGQECAYNMVGGAPCTSYMKCFSCNGSGNRCTYGGHLYFGVRKCSRCGGDGDVKCSHES